ncbi:AAA-domain-containing protein [Cystobasidium minutum MCA 4210]|uniref:AAA-domain-containing protein n=1 Tax=Cystobasidium minutum MCA 4210 TaxID=1397322 RepID=UPI0034D00F1B|eukprot:jgi/Rhomi1/168287/fgenesh1_kg.2_\
MPKHATVRLQPLQTCLVNLPLSLYGQLVSRSVTPQSLVVCLSFGGDKGNSAIKASSKSRDGKDDANRVYVGWSGMPSRLVGGVAAIGKGQEALEMDPVCARELGLAEGVEVTIDFLRNLPAARTVNVEPASADDWEVVESHAEYLEQNLLSQVRAASPGQTVCVWVGKSKSLVKMKIISVEPAEDIAVRLTVDTEVIVAPKTRYGPKAKDTEKHDIGEASASSSKAPKPLSLDVQKATKQLLRLLPETYPLPAAPVSEKEPEVVLIDPHHYSLLSQAFPSTRASLKIMTCPSLSQNALPAAEPSSSTDKGKGKDNAGDDQALSTLVYFKPEAAVAPNTIWISSATRASLRLQGVAFELLQLSAISRQSSQSLQEHSSESAPLSDSHINGTPISEDSSILAGFDKHITKSLGFIEQAITSSRLASLSNGSTSGLLVCGGSGSGKTSLAEEIARQAELNASILTRRQYIKCAQLVNLRIPQLKSRLEEEFTAAAWHAPSLVIFDDLDLLIPAEVEHIDSFRSLHVANLFTSTASKASRNGGIIILATAKAHESLHAQLSQSHLFSERITLIAPDKESRKEILSTVAKAKVATSQDITFGEDFNFASIAAQTDGYLPVDLRDLVDRTLHQAAIRAGKSGRVTLELSLADVRAAQADFTPLSLRDVKLQKSEVEWSDIGGLQETRRVLRETLEWPTKYGAIFASSPLRLRSGLLLYGFPGCGKTLLASAVAKECGLNFISVKGPEILNKYIGASEKSVRDLFERAQSAKPCVLFFDEFDSIAPKRGHDSTGVTDRVVNQMLTQMDGAEGLDGVYVLAATSRPDLIDPALLRPGRLDKSLLCDMPNPEDRRDILRACSRKIGLSPDVDLDDYVQATDGYSGADLQAVLYNAHLACVHSNLTDTRKSSDETNGAELDGQDVDYIALGANRGGPNVYNGVVVKSKAEKAQMTKRLEQIMLSLRGGSERKQKVQTTSKAKSLVQPHHIKASLETTRPSVPKDELRRLQRIYDEFVSARAKGGLPDGRPSDEIGGRSSLM